MTQQSISSIPHHSDTHQLLLRIFHATASQEKFPAGDQIIMGQKMGDLSFNFINNPDGSMRWIIPTEAKKPHFLSLYSNDSLKAWIYKNGIKLGYKVGGKALVCSGKFSLNEAFDYRLLEVARSFAGNEFAIFTGTAGKNRKTVVALAPDGELTDFLKIAHTEQAQTLLSNEVKQIQRMTRRGFKHWVIPKVKPTTYQHMCRFENVKPAHALTQKTFTKTHLNALQELWQDKSTTSLSEVSWFAELAEKLFSIPDPQFFPNDLDKSKLSRILNKLKRLFHTLTQKQEIAVASGHGDFTPWNMYLTANKLHVFDWELAKADYPLYFDFFHYFYQSEILLKNQSSQILPQIEAWATSQLDESWRELHRWYLLLTVTQYVYDYASWTSVFVQAHWLVDAWDQMLGRVVIPANSYQNCSNMAKIHTINS